MKQLNKIALLLAVCWSAVLAAGCTMEGGELAEKDRNKVMTCKDTRDGEVFQFNTNTIRNVRAGIGAPSSFDVTTFDGREMTLTSDTEAWIKCEKSR
jgi:hypothetical protein